MSEDLNAAKEVNFIYSLGYGNELIHTGMICYLCDLWNSNNKTPLETFLKSLTGTDLLKKSKKLDAIHEFKLDERKRADLVIREGNNLIVAIEMKTNSKIEAEQIKGYLCSDKLANTPILFITMDLSEYDNGAIKKLEDDNRLKQISTQQIYNAVKAIPENYKNVFLRQWEESLKDNLELRKIFMEERGFKEFKEKLLRMSYTVAPERYWNICFLGNLKYEIEKDKRFGNLKTTKRMGHPSVYLWGANDTILNFWWADTNTNSENKTYIEINNNAKLNLKFKFSNEEEFGKTKEYYKNLFPKSEFIYKERNRNGKTITLLNFDIKLTKLLSDNVNLFTYSNSKEATIMEIFKILERYNEGDMR